MGSNWFGLTVNMLVGFFLSPFILHRLGDDAFGLWVLVFSVTGYYGLFDLGIRSSIVKYVAHYSATGDRHELARVINTSLFTYSCVALVLLVVTFVGSAYVDRVFHVSPSFLRTARLLFLIVGSAVAVGFPLGVFGGVLEGLQKFFWLNVAQAGSTLLRAALIVIALDRGRGLLTIAFITVLLPLVASCIYIVITLQLIPLHLGRELVSRASFRQLFTYGSVTFVIIVAEQLRFQADAAVIGVFLSASAITFFSIGSKLSDYAVAPVNSMAEIFLPMSSQFHAGEDADQLRRVFMEGNRICGFVMFPICATLLVLGKPLIDVWVGPRYESSYVILVLLLLPKTLYRAQAASTRVLFGMARHRPLAVVALLEGATNLILSVALVRRYGVVGDALGTTIPLLATSVLFLPVYLCRLLQLPIRTFLGRAYVLPLALCGPLVGVLLLMQHLFRAQSYLQLLAQLVGGGFVYAAGLLWVFFTKDASGIKLRQRLAQHVKEVF